MKTTLLTFGWLLIFLMGLALTAYGNDVTVTIEESVEVEYTGGDVNFEPEMGESSLGLMNLGNLNWWANVDTWRIKIIRTDWDADPGWGNHGTSDIHLQIKKGPIENTSWHTITTDLTEWLTYEDMEPDDIDRGDGTGTFTGVDWKIKQIGWDDASPYGWLSSGVYTCTVTFSIITP